ncbi:MAG: 3-isopropylmalate dehydrogenase [Dehalococcoidia bacterium]|nr:3-isopropylmalate dehydrogenase [Dehalococcoidia bacterium]HCV00995.1 3-isopropylmalate dehydrogenase [Dehalococcoidia bacterium]|tara:strand:- start:18593 stop:19687 length:1095 start_codon:yes stop_codon:yes gene_type:complete
MPSYPVLLASGDGIGPEVLEEGLKVLNAVERRYGYEFQYENGVVGGAAIDQYGIALQDETLEAAARSRAVLFGAVGGPKWDDPQASIRPEQAILGLRKGLGLFANIRPVRVNPLLLGDSAIKREVLEGVDMIVVRELTGGIYFGKPQKRWVNSRGRQAVDTMRYSEREIERILRTGFELARGRRHKLTSVDKANVLDTSRLWREIAVELSEEYPDVELEHVLVDACSMHLITHPDTFDVIVTGNMFGDILTDEASVLAGSMGMLPSASLGRRRRNGTGIGMYEPIHGSAPDIAGKGIANPIAMILSVALMLRHSLALEEAAVAVEQAVDDVLSEGYRTVDIQAGDGRIVDTARMGTLVAEHVLA